MLKRISACIIAAACLLHAYAVERDSVPHTSFLIVQTVGACAVNTALTEILKSSVHELRPNGEDNHSFPSRHTSWTFTATTLLSNDLYRISPWLSLGSQAVADAVALQRIGSKAHYASDVIVGAGVGIFSAELSTIVTRKIFDLRQPFNPGVANDFRRSLAVTSRAVYHLNSPAGRGLCTGFASGIDLRLPVEEHWGVAFSAEAEAVPLKKNNSLTPLWGLSAMAGVATHLSTPVPALAVECSAMAGAVRWLKADGCRNASWGLSAGVQTGVSWRFTETFATRAAIDYRIATMHTALHCIGLTISSVAYF